MRKHFFKIKEGKGAHFLSFTPPEGLESGRPQEGSPLEMLQQLFPGKSPHICSFRRMRWLGRGWWVKSWFPSSVIPPVVQHCVFQGLQKVWHFSLWGGAEPLGENWTLFPSCCL